MHAQLTLANKGTHKSTCMHAQLAYSARVSFLGVAGRPRKLLLSLEFLSGENLSFLEPNLKRANGLLVERLSVGSRERLLSN